MTKLLPQIILHHANVLDMKGKHSEIIIILPEDPGYISAVVWTMPENKCTGLRLQGLDFPVTESPMEVITLLSKQYTQKTVEGNNE